MKLILYNYTGSIIDAQLISDSSRTRSQDNTKIDCGQTKELEADGSLAHLQLKCSGSTTVVKLPLKSKTYSLAIGIQLMSGQTKLINCVDGKLVGMITDLSTAYIDEVIGLKTVGLDLTNADPKAAADITKTLGFGNQLSQKICSNPIAQKLNICDYDTINWLFLLIIAVIFVVVFLTGVVAYKHFSVKANGGEILQ